MNNFQKTLICIFVINFINLYPQDSLYLITTIEGNNSINPIYYSYGLGDINGDGYDDFAIKYLYTNYFDIYFGSDTLKLDNKYQFQTSQSLTSDFTFPLKLWDINHDGIDDFYFEGYIQDSLYKYHTYLNFYLGKSILDTISFMSLIEHGSLVAKGDINGDGYIDFTTSLIGESEVHLFLGHESFYYYPPLIIRSGISNDNFGNLIDIGDLNGDGFDDLLINSNYVNESIVNSKIYIYNGKSNINTIPDLTFEIPFAIENILFIGDFNGDGFDDFVIQITGKTRLYLGSENLDSDNYFEFPNQSSTFGHNIGRLGDINNDGYDDLAVSSYTKVEIFLGNSNSQLIADFSLVGVVNPWGNFGSKISNLGDLNKDGFNEFCILEENYPDFDNRLGKLYIYSMKDFIVGVKEELFQTEPFFELLQNYPNPFNPSTKIRYSLPYISNVELNIYDIMGNEIKSIKKFDQSAGYNEIIWDGRNNNGVSVSSGIYFYRVKAVSLENNLFESSATSKMILIK